MRSKLQLIRAQETENSADPENCSVDGAFSGALSSSNYFGDNSASITAAVQSAEAATVGISADQGPSAVDSTSDVRLKEPLRLRTKPMWQSIRSAIIKEV